MAGIYIRFRAQCFIQAAAFFHRYVVSRIAAVCTLRMADISVRVLRCQILIYAAAHHNINKLAAAANAENRLACLVEGFKNFCFKHITFVIGHTDMHPRFFAEKRRIGIRPAGNNERVKHFCIIFAFSTRNIRQHNGQRAQLVHKVSYITGVRVSIGSNGNT